MPGVLADLFARRVLFVTGKGGVGKSTVSAALAWLGNQRGLRVLVVDVEAKGDAARFLDGGPSAYRPREIRPGLSHLSIQPEDALEEYLRRGIKIPRLWRLGPVGKVFDFIATAAPGVEEVLIAGKVWYEERAMEGSRPRWDLVVVDAAPSGQVLSHIRGPRTLMELVSVGLIRNQTESVREVLEDGRRCGIVVVSLLEEMPVAETEELVGRTPKEVDTPILALVANRAVAPPRDPDAVARVEARATEVSSVIGADLAPALEALRLSATIAANQVPHRDRLIRLGLPMLEVPDLPIGRHGLSTTTRVAEALSRA